MGRSDIRGEAQIRRSKYFAANVLPKFADVLNTRRQQQAQGSYGCSGCLPLPIWTTGGYVPRNLYALLPPLEPYFSRIRFNKEQKRLWFRDREGLLFGFGVGFYIFLKIPLLGVLIYGVAEASTAYLITKITDPPPSPAYSEKFAESQVRWTNKHEFLRLPLANLDAHNTETNSGKQNSSQARDLPGKRFS
ncbi:MAG: hypothetical protein LQ352_002906 [Teloschistes flavicans]|nr:MAG: hypothetical protein LQ352_002906 [Teloschistes flavicans]